MKNRRKTIMKVNSFFEVLFIFIVFFLFFLMPQKEPKTA